MKSYRDEYDEAMGRSLDKIVKFLTGKNPILDVDITFGPLPPKLSMTKVYKGLLEEKYNDYVEAAKQYFGVKDENNIPQDKVVFITQVCEKEGIEMDEENTLERGIILKRTEKAESKSSTPADILLHTLDEYIEKRRAESHTTFGYSKEDKVSAVGLLKAYIKADVAKKSDIESCVGPHHIKILTQGRLGTILGNWVKSNRAYAGSILPKELNDKLIESIDFKSNITRAGRYGR